MKDKYSIAQRNRVVEENLCCIDTVLRVTKDGSVRPAWSTTTSTRAWLCA